MEAALAQAAAKERRAAQEDAIRADLQRGKEAVRVAADRGLPLATVLRIKAAL
jgi:hypothetical protein